MSMGSEDEGAREAAVAALDPVILLGDLSARAFAANHDAAFFGINFDLFA